MNSLNNSEIIELFPKRPEGASSFIYGAQEGRATALLREFVITIANGAEFGVITAEVSGPCVDRAKLIGKLAIEYGEPELQSETCDDIRYTDEVTWKFSNHSQLKRKETA